LNIVMSVLYASGYPLVSSVEHCIVCSVRLQVTPWYLQLNIVMYVLYGFRY
jgi:hypothetical protein